MKKFSHENTFTRAAVGERVRLIRGGLTCQAFGDRLGVSPGFVSEIEHGRKKPSTEMLFGLAVHFGVDINWLLRGDAPAGRIAETPPPYGSAPARGGRRGIPLYRLDQDLVSAEETITLSARFMGPHMIAVHVTDDSMVPTIPPGSLVGIDERAKAVKTGDVYLVTLKTKGRERPVLRRVFKNGGVRLRADNQRYADLSVPARGLRIRGAVVWILRWGGDGARG